MSGELDRGFRLGDWEVKPLLGTLSARGETRRLEPRVMTVLVCLAEHAGDPVTRDQFNEEVWRGRVVSDEVLSRSISLLRTALDDSAREPRYIQTLTSIGYRLIADVAPLVASTPRRATAALPTPGEPGRPFVFVSYAHDDVDLVVPEIEWLKSEGFNVWYDRGIRPGSQWTDELAERIMASNVFLYYVTPRSVASRNCMDEANFALEIDKPFVATHLEPTELPMGLRLRSSTRQAILRHELSEASYREKLRECMRSYFEPETSHEAGGPSSETPTLSLDVDESKTQPEPNAAAPSPATTRLVLYLRLKYRGRTYAGPLDGVFTMGRSSECSLVLESQYVSRVHGQIEHIGGIYRYRDLSQNGTFLSSPILPGGELLIRERDRELPPRGTLRIADELIEFDITDQAPSDD